MKRHYFISEDLDELAAVEHELEAKGIAVAQLHVLSEKEAEVEQHHLPEVSSFMKRDVLHYGEMGAVVGVAAAVLVLVLAYLTGLTQTMLGWLPFVFLALVVLGFCTWEGGMFGLRKPNTHFRRFQQQLKDGKHVFFVEVEPAQEALVQEVAAGHPRLHRVAGDDSMPGWIVKCRKKWRQFMDSMP